MERQVNRVCDPSIFHVRQQDTEASASGRQHVHKLIHIQNWWFKNCTKYNQFLNNNRVIIIAQSHNFFNAHLHTKQSLKLNHYMLNNNQNFFTSFHESFHFIIRNLSWKRQNQHNSMHIIMITTTSIQRQISKMLLQNCHNIFGICFSKMHSKISLFVTQKSSLLINGRQFWTPETVLDPIYIFMH